MLALRAVNDYRVVRVKDLPRKRMRPYAGMWRMLKDAPLPLGYEEVPEATGEDGNIKPEYYALPRLGVHNA